MAAHVLKNISGTPGSRKLSKTISNAFEQTDLAKAKENIQKELFTHERLVSCITVTKTKDSKKKKPLAFLCVTVTSEKPVICKLHSVKKTEKGDGFKKKSTWEIGDLKSVDGHLTEEGEGQGEGTQVSDFDLTLEKLYRWRAEDLSQKAEFLQVLWKLSKRYLKVQPVFENTGKIITDVTIPSADTDGQAADEDSSYDPLGDLAYQIISSKEENDLTQLIMDSEIAISDAHRFADKLTLDLSMLDGANVHSIVSSEDHVLQLMQLIDEAVKEVTLIEERLSSYDQVIMVVKAEMERMKDKDNMMKVHEANHDSLIESLSTLVKSLDLPHDHQRALKNIDLASAQGINACTEAAMALQQCLESQIEPSLLSMEAVKDQKNKMQKLSSEFARRLTHHLNNLFTHKTTESKINSLHGTLRSGEIRMQNHHNQHRDLLPYTGLMLWLRKVDFSKFHSLQTTYTDALKAVYEKEIGDFLEAAKLRVGNKESKHVSAALAVRNSAGSSESLQSLDPRQRTADKQARQAFNKMIEKVFAELSPICMAEQEFCVKFFHMLGTAEGEDDKTADHSTRLLLGEIFQNLEKHLSNFINHCVKQDTFYSLSLLVHLSHHTKLAASSGLFLSKVYGTASVSVKRTFDEYIKVQCKSFEETKPSKKSRCGIISFVHVFEEFAEQSESIFHNSDRRSDLDKAYKVLAQKLFTEVARIASEHLKTPRHVIMFENLHRIHALLSQMKISCLDAERKEARLRYQEHMQAYVQEQLGTPMEKLTLFFEGVEEKLKSGVKEEEVGYLLAFNKTELRKVIKEYPAKEVRKGLETLYKKLEKHMCEEENLLQVVWTSVQKQFLHQYNLFVSMLKRCYADSNISLDFSINDILQMFSDIAQLH